MLKIFTIIPYQQQYQYGYHTAEATEISPMDQPHHFPLELLCSPSRVLPYATLQSGHSFHINIDSDIYIRKLATDRHFQLADIEYHG
jgi:hypothetical protein